MDYQVTWLDAENNILGTSTFVDQDNNSLLEVTKAIVTMIEEKDIPEDTVFYSVELYDQ